ncbi:MAG TPA: tRNA (adenosine(37)-N6)-dimethylallyltransferase MiaA [Bacteroidales bacterium]|nr:tRNA (adenosine(37)-N6)-dimethylallyltransferase MiaA [Bacteroidales bacterium]
MTTLITILGPTATGKTTLAASLASVLGAEIISADSRQVYRGMNIGTGKDLGEYLVDGKQIPLHLIDIADPGDEYNVFRFRKDFSAACKDIFLHGDNAILCGGSGMYLSSVLQDYQLAETSWDPEEMKILEKKSDKQLISILQLLKTPHNTTDLLDRKRLIRAIMIGRSGKTIPSMPVFERKHTFGISFERSTLRQRITNRLDYRLQNGMIEEVQGLLDSGTTPEQLKFYGLEYRYITAYLGNEITYHEMFRLLNIAIHQFAKRQMTWFRRMEHNGVEIHWIDGNLSLENKMEIILRLQVE